MAHRQGSPKTRWLVKSNVKSGEKMQDRSFSTLDLNEKILDTPLAA